jgi:carbamoyl-phosphate synthase small subunit
MTAYVLLEDGIRLDGDSVGTPGPTVGEVVFNTAMTGYQEAVTDPSYAGQIITFTYPLIGNYGVWPQAVESDRPHARAVIMREPVNSAPEGSDGGWLDWLSARGVSGIGGVDTRGLVRHIRDRGAMRGGIFPGAMPEHEARALIEAEAPMLGRDLAREVTPSEPITIGDGGGPHVVALDTGIKTSIATSPNAA